MEHLTVNGSAWSLRANGHPNVNKIALSVGPNGGTITAITEKSGHDFCSISLDRESLQKLATSILANLEDIDNGKS